MWIHMAPPCRTFTRARDGRRDGGPGRLRSDAKPEGWGNEAEEGNLLALRAEAFAEEQEKGGRLFTIEHPLRSYMWDLKPFKKRRKEGRGTLFALDQCAFGAPHQKPTGLLTNGECFHALAKRCREAPKHTHVPLKGKVWDETSGSEVWRTSLTAAYPEGMCRAMAEAFSRHLLADRPTSEKTAEEVREQENERCVGGMRGPAESVRKIPGWAKVGDLLRPSLCEAVEESKDLQRAFEEYSAEMDGKQWAERFGPVLAEVGAKVAGKMADALGASGLENVVGPTGWRHGLLGKMVEVAGDPEVDVPNWLGGKTPLGVSKEVPGRGIFPKAGPTEAQLASYEFLAGRTAWDVDSNYTSYVEHSEESRKELLRLVEEAICNRIAAEIALQVAWAQIHTFEHYRNTLNVEADALSRVGEGKDVPKRLRRVPRDSFPVEPLQSIAMKDWPRTEGLKKEKKERRKRQKEAGGQGLGPEVNRCTLAAASLDSVTQADLLLAAWLAALALIYGVWVCGAGGEEEASPPRRQKKPKEKGAEDAERARATSVDVPPPPSKPGPSQTPSPSQGLRPAFAIRGEGSKDLGPGGGGQGGGPEKDYSYEYDEEDEEEEETSDDDPVELPSLTSLPACCSCPRQGAAVFHKKPRPAEDGVITRPDSAGNLLGGVCLNPQGWGTLRFNQDGTMRRLCGHIVCPRRRGNTCRCCAARAKTPSGAGQLPVSLAVHVRDRVPAEAVGPVGASKAGGAPHL
ncbi:hypothetical protein AK812_SmicGene46021, partial [Symbiodinium microadriaticum]